MKRKILVSLGSHYENFINEKIMSGKYISTEDVIVNALKLLEMEEKKLQSLRKDLEAGETSLMIEEFDSQEYLSKLHGKYL
jgi:antitoxin ParD1/3/4